MRKQISLVICSLLLGAAAFLNGCVKDTVTRSYTYTLWRPVYKTTAAVRANIKSNDAVAVRQPGKLFIKGRYIFLNEVDKGVHIIDNSDPAHPKNTAFLDIPGNVDLAVKGNTLYADLYTDLVAIDISDPRAAHVTKIVEGVFPNRYYSAYVGTDSAQVIADWVVKDTTVTEVLPAGQWITWNKSNGQPVPGIFNSRDAVFIANPSSVAASAPAGMSGSMARFTIVNERLYTIGQAELSVFNISKNTEPSFTGSQQVGFNIETIYPFKDKLFVGSTNGMFVYSIANPDQPVRLSQYSHVQSCDPVIADGDYAYVTLRSGTVCNGFTNQLEVLDIDNVLQPSLVKTYTMTNPHGLSKEGNLLFICDGAAGLKVYDAKKPDALQLVTTISGIETYDVIASNGVAIVAAKDGLYQYDFSDRANIRQLSKISLN